MIQFYAPEIKATGRLPQEESAHCIRVLRKRAGDRIFVTDGIGNRFECLITDANPKQAAVKIVAEESISPTRNFSITLLVAPTKNADRMAWLVEKAVEIGVDRIIFCSCRHSERKNVNVDRLRKITVSAMNQSLKTRLPEVEGMVPLSDVLSVKGEKYFGYCDANHPRTPFVDLYTPDADVAIAIGPEGDFSQDEVEKMIASGFKPVTFGNERLRTETAALYAVTAVHVLAELKKESQSL
ncbi:MAG: 16S rRNA (uracil(1498)-N(3))-methyltransferase [Muribaculaceae bacterium]|nr:16S rRNA (uracil(1498)-N(3))-methyltransferase [Muribaculaceae bacterium]